MKREWLLAAAVLVPVALGMMGCKKPTTPPVSTESNRPIGDIAPVDSTTGTTDMTMAPADPPMVDTMPPAGGRVYVVQKGDGLMAIARKFYNGDASQYRKIAAANNLQPPYPLTVGQRLVIP